MTEDDGESTGATECRPGVGCDDHDPERTRLAGETTVADYRRFVADQARELIANLIQRRFTKRYLDPVTSSDPRSGFAMMAVGCLMIESLESFRLGLPDSSRESERLFCSFFQRHDGLAAFRPVAHDFYKHVRCGILHQAETTGRWRIRREGFLLDVRAATPSINAVKFLGELRVALDEYVGELSRSHWDADVSLKARKKLRAICRNCGVRNLQGL